MPNYKIVNTDQLDADLKAVADSIREKSGKSGSLAFPGGFVSAVNGIETGGGGGGVESCVVHVKFNCSGDYYGNASRVFYSKVDGGITHDRLVYEPEWDDYSGEAIYPSVNEYDIVALCGSQIIIADNEWALSADCPGLTKTYSGIYTIIFIPTGTTTASITITF